MPASSHFSSRTVELRGVGNVIRNIVLGLLLTLPLDPSTLYGLKSFYRTKIDPIVAECEAKLQNRFVFSPPLVYYLGARAAASQVSLEANLKGEGYKQIYSAVLPLISPPMGLS